MKGAMEAALPGMPTLVYTQRQGQRASNDLRGQGVPTGMAPKDV
jgi:hypothetical protein